MLLKVGNNWCKEPRDNDLKPDWLKMSSSMNNKSEYECEKKTTAEECIKENHSKRVRGSKLLRADECKM